MNTERINEEAKAFQKDNSCFIHVECDEGRHEAVIVGDGNALITSLAVMIDSVANSCQGNFEGLMKILIAEHLRQKMAEEMGETEKDVTSFAFPNPSAFPKREKPDEES